MIQFLATCNASHYAHRANAQLACRSRDSSSARLSGINHLFFPKISVPSDPLNPSWNVAVCAEGKALKGVLGGMWLISIENSFSRSVDIDMWSRLVDQTSFP